MAPDTSPVAAFEGGVVDYLLKPVEAARLRLALDRVSERRARAAEAGPPRLALPTRSGLVLLSPEEVLAARIEGASTVVESDKGRFFTERPFQQLAQVLGPGFLRAHRQALVNLGRVRRLEDSGAGGYIAHLDGDVTVPVSRQVARALRRRWGL